MGDMTGSISCTQFVHDIIYPPNASVCVVKLRHEMFGSHFDLARNKRL